MPTITIARATKIRTLVCFAVSLCVLFAALHAEAQPFNLATLGLGPVEIVYIEHDADGPRVVLVRTTKGYVIVNPRRPQDPWKPGVFCWEFPRNWGDLLSVPNPSVKWTHSPIVVDGKTKIQAYDSDFTDKVAPWMILDLEFVHCQ